MKFQVFNPAKNCWVKMKQFKSGKTRIMDVKQREPNKPFKGVPTKGR